MVGRHALEHVGLRLARLDGDPRAHALADAREPLAAVQRLRDRALERERQRRRAEQHAVRVHLDLVLLAPVVEPRLDLELELHRAADDDDAPEQPVPVHVRLVLDRHEVLHLAHAAVGEEARDQDVRVREVELLGVPAVTGGPQREEAALVLVEDRAEHARRVERRAAVPVDRPVRADERDRVQVADQSVLGDREVVPLVLAADRQGQCRRVLVFDGLDLPEPADVALLAGELRERERRHDLRRQRGADHARAEAEHVDVVVLDRLVRGVGVVRRRRADPGELAGRHGRRRRPSRRRSRRARPRPRAPPSAASRALSG